MERLRKGVWFSKKSVKLDQYKASSGRDVYWILAENIDQAHEKAADWRKNYTLEIDPE